MLKTDGSKRPTELSSGVDFLVQECRCVSVAIIVASLDEGPGEMVDPDPSVWREDGARRAGGVTNSAARGARHLLTTPKGSGQTKLKYHRRRAPDALAREGC